MFCNSECPRNRLSAALCQDLLGELTMLPLALCMDWGGPLERRSPSSHFVVIGKLGVPCMTSLEKSYSSNFQLFSYRRPKCLELETGL